MSFVLKCTDHLMKLGIDLQIWHPSVTFNVASILAPCDSHVARFSPSCAPGVTDSVEAFIFVVSNIDDSMVVRRCAAWGIVKDTIIVVLEIAVGINVHGVGTVVVNTWSKRINTFVLHIDKVVSRDAYSFCGRFAVGT